MSDNNLGNSKKIIKEIDHIGKPRNTDTFKATFDEDYVQIDFGIWKDESTVEVVSKLLFSEEILIRLFGFFVAISKHYEAIYGKSLIDLTQLAGGNTDNSRSENKDGI